jgi:hypothetical protein
MHPDIAAQAVVRALNLSRLREQLFKEIKTTKAKLKATDAELRVL